MPDNLLPQIDLEKFNYQLPKERIALFPLDDRSKSRLLAADTVHNTITHSSFEQIADFLRENSLLILNSTKVIAARIPMRKLSGGKAELLITDPVYPSVDPQITLAASSECTWKCILGGRHIDPDDKLIFDSPNPQIRLYALIKEKIANEVVAEFHWHPEEKSFSEILNTLGSVPLPPYIKREAQDSDRQTYQTVYAQSDGSVAAPTAGLHFTDDILLQLRSKNIQQCKLVLHVGPGTFKPIDTEDISRHDMHSEQIFIGKESLVQMLNTLERKEKIIATGTTSLRTLESIYWFALKLLRDPNTILHNELLSDQWDPYKSAQNGKLPSFEQLLPVLLEWMEKNKTDILSGRTKLLIVPGYKVRTINALITNFHMPKSTLILLVAALTGYDFWKRIYNEALRNNYRFLSYGDSSLILL